jgi:hypothetical protein
MKKLVVLALFLATSVPAEAEISTRVCLADANIPFHGGDVMVGTRLTIVVRSDTDDYWSGSLAVADVNMDYGVLSARHFNDVTHDWECSRFEAAGPNARVWDWEESGIDGFDFYADVNEIYREAGDWLIIDYTAAGTGTCKVGFYDHNISWTDPCFYLTFSHVRTRDFNNDTNVDFRDLHVLTSYWLATYCGDPDQCEGVNLSIDGSVDLYDFALLAQYWRETTEYNRRSRDFNDDTKVDFLDLAVLSSHCSTANCRNVNWCEGADLNRDCTIDLNDLRLFAHYWLKPAE